MLKYARGGTIRLVTVNDPAPGLEFRAIDDGPGFSDLTLPMPVKVHQSFTTPCLDGRSDRVRHATALGPGPRASETGATDTRGVA